MNDNEQITGISKGGRGKKADYETTIARIPLALKEFVQTIGNEYKLTGNIPSLDPVSVSQPNFSKEEAIALANQLIKSKKGGAKYCLENLLQVIYLSDISLG